MEAKNPELCKIGSHSVGVTGNHRWEVDKEELFPYLEADWRGERVRVSMEANRYRSSDGDWSPWRIYVRDARTIDGTDYGTQVPVSDAMRRALQTACEPLVTAWLTTDPAWLPAIGTTYAESRTRAFRWLMVHELRDSRGGYDGKAASLLNQYRDELTPEDAERLDEALAAQVRFFELIDFKSGD